MSGSSKRELVSWLIGMEKRAESLYRKAAGCVVRYEALASFLTEMAEEEVDHQRLLGELQWILEEEEGDPPEFELDRALRERIESRMDELESRVTHECAPTEVLLESVLQVELSEWNDLFLHVLRWKLPERREIQQLTAELQAHLNRMYTFIQSLPPDLQPELLEPPRIRECCYLVVDDNEGLLELLRRLLSRSGTVDVAADGKAALRRIRNRYYDLILSDVEMPGMNGIELYREALREDPSIEARFVFFSGTITPRREKYFRRKGLRYFRKPLKYGDLVREVERVARQNR